MDKRITGKSVNIKSLRKKVVNVIRKIKILKSFLMYRSEVAINDTVINVIERFKE